VPEPSDLGDGPLLLSFWSVDCPILLKAAGANGPRLTEPGRPMPPLCGEAAGIRQKPAILFERLSQSIPSLAATPRPPLRGVHRLSHLAGPALVARLLGERLVAPMFHSIRDSEPPHWRGRCRLRRPAGFEADLDWLLRWGPAVSLGDLRSWTRGEAQRPRGFFLSFDDCYRDWIEVVAPLLKRKGIPATFFVTTSLIDHQSIFHEDHIACVLNRLEGGTAAMRAEADRILARFELKLETFAVLREPGHPAIGQLGALVEFDAVEWMRAEQPYLSADQVRELIGMGFSIGAHSIDHPLFSKLTASEQREQVRGSLEVLERRFGIEHRAFAFPYSELGVSREGLESILRDGEVEILFGTRGVIRDELEPRILQRVSAESLDTIQRVFKQAMAYQAGRRSAGQGVVRR
jgi:peptidoglycan/xylan/chitin deacetylase (PgdA/CDA1 family)